jgi:hypothetical protein
VYFTRTNPAKSVDLKTVDSDLLCGETMGMPLESLQSLITHVYRPLIGAQEDWKNCSEEPVAPASSNSCALSCAVLADGHIVVFIPAGPIERAPSVEERKARVL